VRINVRHFALPVLSIYNLRVEASACFVEDHNGFDLVLLGVAVVVQRCSQREDALPFDGIGTYMYS